MCKPNPELLLGTEAPIIAPDSTDFLFVNFSHKHCCDVQALEAALPPTTSQFMQLLAAHAAAGPQHSFATCQLLQLAATCMVQPVPSCVLAASETLA